MFRRLFPLAVAVVVVLGCSKKKDDDSGGGDSDPTPTGPALTIKLRDEKVGDKLEIVQTETESTSMEASGPKGKVSKSQKGTQRYEYTETVLEKPEGASNATKATEAYKVAEKTQDGGPKRPFSYAKKTVLIEKRGGIYTFTVNGIGLPQDEAKRFQDIYGKADKFKNEDWLPTKAVQVYEKWSLDRAILKKLGTVFKAPINAEQSTGTGRLIKAYTKDGQQWGVIELKINVVLDGTVGGTTLNGNLSMTLTLDTAIDGSSPDGVMTMKMHGKIASKQGGITVDMLVEGERTETRKAVQ